jgi:hypothetical protein
MEERYFTLLVALAATLIVIAFVIYERTKDSLEKTNDLIIGLLGQIEQLNAQNGALMRRAADAKALKSLSIEIVSSTEESAIQARLAKWRRRSWLLQLLEYGNPEEETKE